MNWTRQQMLYKERKYTQKEEEMYEENLPDENPAMMEETGKTELEETIRMRALRTPRNRAYLNALMKGDDMNDQDEEIVSKVQQKIEEQQEEYNFEKKQKEKQIDKLIGVLTKCYIHGCCVHTIDKSGRIIKHYGKGMKGYDIMDINSMSERLKKGYQLYQVSDCVCVEVYEQHMCIVGSNGKTKVTEE